MIGEKFGMLVVIAELEVKRYKNKTARKMKCRCECGKEKDVFLTHLRSRKTVSCGCISIQLATERIVAIGTKHGLYHHPLYGTHNSMKNRCSNPNNKKWKHYGGRGIKVCDRWLGEDGFKNFIKDMGNKPTPKHTLDRIDNQKGYSPENCRWATYKQNNDNRRVFKHTNQYTKDI